MSTTLATNMMRSQSQREHLQGLLTEAVTGLCRSSLKYCNKFSVEGLLGITVDDNEVLLISMKETVNSGDITGNDGIKFGGRAIAVAKKRTARVAGLPTFTSTDNFHNQRSAADQHSLFTATNSDSNNFSDLQTVIPNDAFESSPPSNKKPCRSPSIGSAGSAPSPSFTPNNPTQEIAFPNMSQVGGNHSSCSTPNPNSQSAPWSPESGTYRLGSISLPGGSGAPLVQDADDEAEDDDDDDDIEVIEDDDDDDDHPNDNDIVPKIDVLKIHRIQKSILLYNGCMVTLRQFLRTSGHKKEEVIHAMVTLTGDQDDRETYIGEVRNCRLTPYVFYKCPPELVKPSVYALYGMSEEIYRFRYYSTCRLPSQHPTGSQWDHLVEDILLNYPFNPQFFPLEHMNLTSEGKVRLTRYKGKLVAMYERDGSIERAAEHLLM